MVGNGVPSFGFTIGEVASSLGVSVGTLREWERHGIVSPRRTAGGIRRYHHEHLRRLREAIRLRRSVHLQPRAIAVLLNNEGTNFEVNQAADPTSPTPNSDDQIGPRLRAARLRAGETLKQVSASTGLSVSFLSALERGQSGIGLVSLQKLTDHYGLTIGSLLDNESESLGRVSRAAQRRSFRLGELKPGIAQLTPNAHKLGVQLFEIEPGMGSEGTYSHEGDEAAYVLEGTFEITLSGTEIYTLQEGDCISFESTIPHNWRNPAPAPARVLWINSPVSF